ncbi:MAG: CC0125/CC1285 family lipoprotein [Geminicoccaceae bacterium]
MRIHGGVLGVAMLGLLGGCGQATPYQPAADGFGYREQQIEENRYRVTFAGNELTAPDTVQNYLLFRAAEITLDRGYDHFVVVDRNLDRSTRYWSSGDTYWGSRFGGGSGAFLGFGTTTAQPIDRYTAYADVVMFRGEEPAADVNAYDARDVLRRLEPTITPAPGVLRRTPQAQQ